MAGLEHAARGRILEEHVGAVLEALTGRAVRVARPRRVRHAEAGHRPAPHVVRRRRRARRGAARGAAAAPDVPDERRPDGARRVLRRGEEDRLRRRLRASSPAARRSCTSPTTPTRRGPRSARTCCTRRRRTRRSRRRASTRSPGVHAASSTISKQLAAVPRRYARRRARARCSALPPTAGVVFNPLAGGLPPALGVAEPRAVRGEGAAATSRARTRIAARISAYRRRISLPTGGVAMARYRRFDVARSRHADHRRRELPSSTTCGCAGPG